MIVAMIVALIMMSGVTRNSNASSLNVIQFAVPVDMQGCHTAILAGYYIEGHVPLEAITRLLAERPNIAGLAVPGMPSGSLGMGDDPGASYDVFAVGKDGVTGVYQAVRPRS